MEKFVGCCKVEVFDKENDITFPMLVMYSTNTASTPVAFGPFSLDVAMNAPVLLLVAEKDYMPQETIAVLRDGLPERAQLTHRLVNNAGHYSFLSPFPEAMKSRVGEAAKDPEGFDREQFHHEMNAEVLSFLQKIFEGVTHAR